MNYLWQSDCKDIAANLRTFRTCCVELTLCIKNDKTSFDKVSTYITHIDQVLLKCEHSSEKQNNTLENLRMFYEFYQTTVQEIQTSYTDQSVVASIGEIKTELIATITKAIEPIHKKITFDNSFERFKNSLNNENDSDIRQSVFRLFCVLVKRDEASKLFTPEIERCSRILSSYYSLKGSIATLSRIIEPLGNEIKQLEAKQAAEAPKAEEPECPKALETPTIQSKPLHPLMSESEKNAEMFQLREEIEKLKLECHRLNQQNSDANDLLTDYMMKLPSIEGDLKAANRLIADKDGEIEEINEQNEKAKNNLTLLQKELDFYKSFSKYLAYGVGVLCSYILMSCLFRRR
ncbi:hypothetical protein TVAG_527170 [Trichomonas vaginalis G3]|uniref:Uncharacterized protein n=1 Tax=Trichomonas vaginalis (strain ATCC PRA-98 / G3) TaxID=412133 RepID=A2G844_TRIV3|nr:hypothetical protein TVAGG3_0805950 [Trichomonas vaginalis G3]EAX86673.1 hypothetical protein TVAG_527170 [Trichomonas vaginalis G3]KAI5496859.1 hypothetical protein TVAGG3_0805950 [Trichomonas vaginalis G3]|eukprot:XP_001299603.1 hypothetical protein [Trichomonas vaginalis G3]